MDFVQSLNLSLELIEDQVPSSVSFDVGYFEGQQHSKMWLCSNDDLKSMYTKYLKGEITLWCEGKGAEQSNVCGKRKRDEPKSSKRQDKEDKVEAVYKELKGKHGERFDAPRLRLWARMNYTRTWILLQTSLPSTQHQRGRNRANHLRVL